MQANTNRQIIEQWFQIIDAKKVERLGEIESADFVMQLPIGEVRGPAAHAELVKGFATAMPNFKHEVTRSLESGDSIACEGTFLGDHTGPMMTPDGRTIPASGNRVAFPWLGIATVKAGKVTQCNVYFDTMALMKQLGAIQ
jgi:predicted ester cyclase